MEFGWGLVPVAPSALELRQEENIEVIQLVTNRASAPSLSDFLAELHNSEVLSDITICSEDGQAIKCHKLVLIRWSAPFRRMLCGDMREAREKHITLHGVDGEVLASFIRFLYTCHCSITTEKLVLLFAMADQYDVTLLQQLCMDAIRMHATNHRCCCLFYKAAKDIQQQEIQQLAWEQLSSNLHSLVQQHDVFVQLEFEDVLRLVSRQSTTSTQHEQQQQQHAGAALQEAAAAGPSSSSSRAGGSSTSPTAAAAAAGDGGGGGGAGSSNWGRLSAAAWSGGWGSLPQPQGPRVQPGDPLAHRQLHGEGAAAAEARVQAAAAGDVPDWPHLQPHRQQQQEAHGRGLTQQDIAVAYQQTGRATGSTQPARRPEYALFLASMAWLHHLPSRGQYRQQLYECFDFNAMRDHELSQMRRNPYVQADPELKEMLLDAFERRCLAHAQTPVYHMAPLPHSTWQA